MNPADLTQEQQSEALRRYYAGEPVQAIIDAYGLDCSPSTFLRQFPPVVLQDQPCPVCGTLMIARRATRGHGSTKGVGSSPPSCPNCGHRETVGCRCKACRSKSSAVPGRGLRRQTSVETAQGAVLASAWADAYACRPEPSDLGVREAVYLLATTRGGLDKAFEIVPSVRELGHRVAPGQDFTSRILRTLADTGLLALDPADAQCGPCTDLRSYQALYADRGRWRLTLGRDGRENKAYLERLQAIVTERWTIDAHGEELADLWAEAVLEECVVNMEGQLAHFGVEIAVTLDLRETLTTLLGYLAGGEVFAATWSASKSVAAEHHAGRYLRDPAAAVDYYLRSLFSRFCEGRLVPYLYDRVRQHPASALAALLEGSVLGIGPQYLRVVPSLASLASFCKQRPLAGDDMSPDVGDGCIGQTFALRSRLPPGSG